MSTLAERLRAALDALPEFNQADLARACGVRPPSVSDWLSGKTRRLEGANLLMAARYLKINPWWLATGAGGMRASIQSESESEAELVESYRRLDPKDQAALRQLLDSLARLKGKAD